MRNILVYNNQTGIAEKMKPLFFREGMETVVVADTEQLYNAIETMEIHLLLVDVELNDKGWDRGIEMIMNLRRKSSVPLIVVSAQSAETAKIMALEAGADDYVTSDCNPLVDDVQRNVTVYGRALRLTPIEYKILRLLVQQRGKVFSNSQIYENIWHMQAIGADNTIAVHIRHIREKIETNPKDPRYLKVVWGNGYKVG